ncbi:hypothetical protein BGZ60DRAFT_401229 [Tricladium varicosporioides]|nr:hypothetical protein BGZ60DRAFT_401229 [Hymenoscyphus varicosporioides]
MTTFIHKSLNFATIRTSTNPTTSQLLFVNPQICNPRNISPGDIICPLFRMCYASSSAVSRINSNVFGWDCSHDDSGGGRYREYCYGKSMGKDINKLEAGEVLNVPLCRKVGGEGPANGTIANGTVKGMMSATKKGGAKATTSGGRMKRQEMYSL